jgi:hypothetical protein
MKGLVKPTAFENIATDSWVKCETRGWLLETLEDYAGLTIRICD